MQELLEQIETWSEANGIKILNGFNASDNGENIIVCKNEELEQFLDVALANNINHLVVDKSLFDLDKALEAVINKNLGKLGRDVEELRSSFKKNLTRFKKYNNEIFNVSIEWQNEGFSYLFEKYADFYEKFLEEIESLKTEQEGIQIANQPAEIPKKEYDILVETIASSDKYFKNHTQPGTKLENVIEEIAENEAVFDKEYYQFPIFRLKRDVEKVFARKYYQKMAKKYSEEIKEMKKQNMTKKAIISKLGITEGMYDKLAYI